LRQPAMRRRHAGLERVLDRARRAFRQHRSHARRYHTPRGVVYADGILVLSIRIQDAR
jgi:hypothetical protein